MKKANNVSQVEQTILFVAESSIKTQKEIENIKIEITCNFSLDHKKQWNH